MKKIDLELPQKINRWFVLEKTERPGYFFCGCECGAEKEVLIWSILSGKSQGCRSCEIRIRSEMTLEEMKIRKEKRHAYNLRNAQRKCKNCNGSIPESDLRKFCGLQCRTRFYKHKQNEKRRNGLSKTPKTETGYAV